MTYDLRLINGEVGKSKKEERGIKNYQLETRKLGVMTARRRAA
jgi:hypothetical protein